MTLFLTRFMGVLTLDASTFEEIEAHRDAAWQSVTVVLLVCLAGGFAALGLGLAGIAGFAIGTIVSLGGWLVWAALDYRSTLRAAIVCVVAWLLSFGVVWSTLMMFSTSVS
jgi:hypothetical protein